MGRPRRTFRTTKFHYDIPVSVKQKINVIADTLGTTQTETLTNIIKEANRLYLVENQANNWEAAGQENKSQNDFVNSWIKEHFGDNPENPEQATSEALKAYHASLGFQFGSDADSFILPKA